MAIEAFRASLRYERSFITLYLKLLVRGQAMDKLQVN